MLTIPLLKTMDPSAAGQRCPKASAYALMRSLMRLSLPFERQLAQAPIHPNAWVLVSKGSHAPAHHDPPSCRCMRA